MIVYHMKKRDVVVIGRVFECTSLVTKTESRRIGIEQTCSTERLRKKEQPKRKRLFFFMRATFLSHVRAGWGLLRLKGDQLRLDTLTSPWATLAPPASRLGTLLPRSTARKMRLCRKRNILSDRRTVERKSMSMRPKVITLALSIVSHLQTEPTSLDPAARETWRGAVELCWQPVLGFPCSLLCMPSPLSAIRMLS